MKELEVKQLSIVLFVLRKSPTPTTTEKIVEATSNAEKIVEGPLNVEKIVEVPLSAEK